MKQIHFSPLNLLLILACVIPVQLFAGDDAPLKKDQTGTGTFSTMSRTTLMTTTETTATVTTTQTATELIVVFNSAVGMAYVSIVSENGYVVYQTVVDTFIDSQVIIPLDSLDTGNYYLEVSYGSTNYIESFNL